MENKNNIQNKVEAALNSLDGAQRATPNPYFYTRVRARLEREYSPWEKLSGFLARPVVAFACACLIIMMNAVFVLSSPPATTSSNDKPELALTEEYSDVATTSIYDIENVKP